MKNYFKIGEISKLYHIGTDSLRYYEELGILNPKRGANEYRMYSIHDLWILNVIRDLRKLGFPMNKIKSYLDNRTIASTETLLMEELAVIETDLDDLLSLREDVKNRLHILQEAKSLPMGKISLTTLPSRNCHRISACYKSDEEMDMLIKQLLNKDKCNLYIIGNNRIGSTIPLDIAMAGGYRNYDSVFIVDPSGDYTIESGTYITISYGGHCSQNSIYIPQMFAYAKEQNLVPTGPVLEILWIDIHQAEDVKEHITQLQLRCN